MQNNISKKTQTNLNPFDSSFNKIDKSKKPLTDEQQYWANRQAASKRRREELQSTGLGLQEAFDQAEKEIADLMPFSPQQEVEMDLAKQQTDVDKTQADKIRDALSKQLETQDTVEDLQNQQLDIQTQSALDELRRRISQSVSEQQQIIEDAPRRFDPFRAESELATQQALRTGAERASLLGDRGGISRGEQLQTQLAGEQRLQDINLAQEDVINQARREIARLESEGRFEEAQLLTNRTLQELGLKEQKLVAEQQAQSAAEAEQRKFDLEQASIQDERQWQLQLREYDRLSDLEKLEFTRRLEQQIDQENALLDAEIQRVRDEYQFAQDVALKQQLFEQNQILENQKAANQRRLEGLKQANRVQLQELEQSAGKTFTDTEVNTAISNFASGKSDRKFAAGSWLIQNIDKLSEEQFETQKFRYNLTDQDLEGIEARIFNVSPSIGQ